MGAFQPSGTGLTSKHELRSGSCPWRVEVCAQRSLNRLRERGIGNRAISDLDELRLLENPVKPTCQGVSRPLGGFIVGKRNSGINRDR